MGRLVIVWGRLQLDASQVEHPGITINLLLLPPCSPWTSLAADDVSLLVAETAVSVAVAGSVPPLATPALPLLLQYLAGLLRHQVVLHRALRGRHHLGHEGLYGRVSDYSPPLTFCLAVNSGFLSLELRTLSLMSNLGETGVSGKGGERGRCNKSDPSENETTSLRDLHFIISDVQILQIYNFFLLLYNIGF